MISTQPNSKDSVRLSDKFNFLFVNFILIIINNVYHPGLKLYKFIEKILLQQFTDLNVVIMDDMFFYICVSTILYAFDCFVFTIISHINNIYNKNLDHDFVS